MTTRVETLRKLIQEIAVAWTQEVADTPTVAAINCGHCAEFRDNVHREFKNHPDLAGIDFDDIYYSDLVINEERPRLPVGLTWDMMDKSKLEFGVLSYVCHEWIRLDGLHFDSEVPNGVTDPFEVPCVRRALVEGLAKWQPDVLRQLAVEPWWQESIRMSATFLDWYASFFNEGFPDTKEVIDSLATAHVDCHCEVQRKPQGASRSPGM